MTPNGGLEFLQYLTVMLVAARLGVMIVCAVYYRMYTRLVVGTRSRHVLGRRLLVLLSLFMLATVFTIVARVYLGEMNWVYGVYHAFELLVSALGIWKILHDDGWFDRQWEKIKKWAKAFRFGLGGLPKFA